MSQRWPLCLKNTVVHLVIQWRSSRCRDRYRRAAGSPVHSHAIKKMKSLPSAVKKKLRSLRDISSNTNARLKCWSRGRAKIRSGSRRLTGVTPYHAVFYAPDSAIKLVLLCRLPVQFAQLNLHDFLWTFLLLEAGAGEEAVAAAVQAGGFDLFDLGGDHGFGDWGFSEFGFDISMSSERVCKCQTFAL